MTDKTDDLLKKLKRADSSSALDEHIDSIKDEFKDFRSYVDHFIRNKGMTVADLQRKSCIDRTYIYQLMDDSRKPGRDKIIAIAIASEMTLEETQRLLEISREGILYAKNKRDSIIIYGIQNSLKISGLNALLEEYGEPQLK